MNIFYTNRDPNACAKDHCDKHAVKMMLEYAQLLSTAHREYGSNDPVLYKSTHKNHPSAKWTRENTEQYKWVYRLWKALSWEYSRRYGKVHASWERLSTALSGPPEGMPEGTLVDPPQCMPDQYKCNDTVKAYRDYVRLDKGFARWNYTQKPKWMK
jgi:hypothetical protein